MKPSIHSSWLQMLLLAVLTLALFAPAIWYSGINLDDPQYVFDNPHVLTGLNLENIRWAFTHVYESWWLPVLWISYMTDATLWGTSAGVFHLVNILLHTANVLLLFWVLRRATGSLWTSVFATALFAIHPLRVESVAWITERKDVLSGLFWMLALAVHVRQAEKPSGWNGAWICLLFLLGLMSKTSIIPLPLALLLMDYWPLQRLQAPGGWKSCLREKALLLVLSAVFAALTLTTHSRMGGIYSPLDWGSRISLIPGNYFAYLAKTFWPINLSIYYAENDVARWSQFVVAALVLLAITWLCWRVRRRAPFLIMGWLWFLIVLFPVIRGVRVGIGDFANRFTYLPSIGLSIMVAWGGASWLKNQPWRRAALGAMAVLVLGACGGLTAYNLRFWRDSDAIFERAWELDPDNYLGITGRGMALQKQGRWEEALAHFQQAVDAHPHVARYRLHLALAFVNMNRLPEAIALLEQAKVREPNESEFLYGLGLAYLQNDQPGLARIHLARAVETAQKLILLYRPELARACFEDGDPAAASEQLRLAGNDPRQQTFTYADLLVFYVQVWNSGEKPRALHYFRKLAASEPENAAVLNNIAWLLATSEHSPAPPDEALKLALKTLELAGEGQPIILDTLAAAYANAGRADEAVRWADTARTLALNQGQKGLARRLDKRIEQYRQGKPWRESMER